MMYSSQEMVGNEEMYLLLKPGDWKVWMIYRRSNAVFSMGILNAQKQPPRLQRRRK